MRILCTGVSHKTAAIAVRERFALDKQGIRSALADFRRRWPDAEVLVISTCNRTEVYTARPTHAHPREEELRGWLCALGGVAPGDASKSLVTLAGAAAAKHLFEVASGLDSLVPGEGQIVAQLKDAYAAASEKQTVGRVLNELVQSALHVAKHVRGETPIGAGKVSVASVAVDCAVSALGGIEGRCVLSIGAGKMNELMLARLRDLGAEPILVANRSAARTRRLAARCGGEAVAFRSIAKHLARAEVLVSSTASQRPILTRKMIAAARRGRSASPLLIIDIAVPRDVESGAGRLKNVHLYNIDDLESVVSSTIRTRRRQLSAAGKIINEHVEEFMESLNVREVVPTIDALYAYMRGIAEEEMSAARKKLRSHKDSKEDAEILERAMHRAIRRILHPAARALRDAAGASGAKASAATIRRLFGLPEKG